MICQLNQNRIHETENERLLQTARFGFWGLMKEFFVNSFFYNYIENAPENSACIHMRNSMIT